MAGESVSMPIAWVDAVTIHTARQGHTCSAVRSFPIFGLELVSSTSGQQIHQSLNNNQ